jgi:chloride channel, nucleotide-sensitive, 1A
MTTVASVFSFQNMEVIHEAPAVNSFVPLVEHESTTPASFYSGPPVLHYHSQNCKVLILEDDITKSATIQRFAQDVQSLSTEITGGSNGESTNNPPSSQDTPTRRVLNDIDVWVTSELVTPHRMQPVFADHVVNRKMLLFSPSKGIGISVPYPTIALHAIQSVPEPSTGDQQGLYMQLLSQPQNPETADDETDSISLTIVPQNDAPPPPSTTDPNSTTEDHSPQPPTVAMFTALSNCSNLNPDPVTEEQLGTGLQDSALFQAGMIAPGDLNGGLPPAMPGSGGWITAENVNQYFDENGNWIGGGEDNDGAPTETIPAIAGTVRPRSDSDGDDDAAAHENGGTDESKWRRTG